MEDDELMTLWILVVNDSGARLLETVRRGKTLKLIQRFPYPAGRKKDGDFYSDRPGRKFDSRGHHRHAMTPEVRPHIHEEEVFAHELMKYLEHSLAENKFDQLALVASPHFLNELRQVIPKDVKARLLTTIAKDYADWINDAELIERINRDLDLRAPPPPRMRGK